MASTKSQKLEDQAATAALYVTKGKDNKSQTKPNNYPLDEHNKHSAASAATSLKHADPRDLPAYPVVGLAHPESSAGAAASLANKDHKSFEHWKPGDIPAASKAAMLAKDYKAAPLWHPELSAAGSKAALLAQKEGGDVKVWRPSPTDAGNSAAGQAMRMKGLSPQVDYGHTEEGGRRAMMAATQSMASGRKRAGSTPVEVSLYPDSKNSAANALKAATSVSRAAAGSQRSQPEPRVPVGPTIDAAKIHNAAVTNLSREMYTSHPPVAPEVEEKNRQAGLRAAAVSMAKQMYDVQQKILEAAAETRRSDSSYAATSVHNRPASAISEESYNPPQYANLQEAAQKLAAERLAKLHDEHAAYRTYYGTQATPQTHRLSIRGRRRRASSDGPEDDQERSQQIRSEMSLFSDKLAQVDAKKRQQDRESLLAAAQRNVRASMHGIDEKVFNETGKVSPAMMEEWEEKAKAKAKAESSARMVNHGKVNIGGGRYMDQSEIDAIAAAKVQPTIDEVTATADKHRARDEELRQQQLERERLAAEKARDQRERDAKTKEDWRRFKEEEKREARARKEEERSRKIEERRLREEEKRKAREAKAASEAPVVVTKEEPKGDAEAGTEAVVAGPEPPVLDPIPATTPLGTDESKHETLPSDEEKTDIKPMPISESDPINASEANLAPVSTEDSELSPVYTAESGGHLSGNPEEIARRVFSAPVEGEPATSTELGDTTSGTEELVNETADTEKAPVIAAETSIVPATETKQSPVVSKPLNATKPEAPIAARVTPTIPAATTETTVSGPAASKLTKDKDTGKVSSWLKTKFSRRASKPTKPESTTAPTESKEKGFIGGVNLTGPDASNTSSDHGDSSMREVALAGKDTAPTTTTTEAPLVSPTAHDDLYSASDRSLHTGPTAAGALARDSLSSPSISSLSSDEDTRGRSAIPREREPISQNQFVHEEIEKGHIDPALLPQSKESESSNGGGEEFEEARDRFDTEKLSPPAAGVIGGTGRKSDSPARDSKFVEDL